MKSILSIILIGLLFVWSGCAPLKKKFIRQKKKSHTEKFIPVLDPIDYPAVHQSAREQYAYHYSLWKVWSRDLLQTLDRDVNKKNQKYLWGQIQTQMQEMKKYISLEKQKELDSLMDKMNQIIKILQKPQALQNRISIKKQLQFIDKSMRKNFKPAVIEKYD